MCRQRVAPGMLAGYITRLLETHGPMTVPDICHELRVIHGIDMSSNELGSFVGRNRHMRDRVTRTYKGFGCGRATLDTYYHLRVS